MELTIEYLTASQLVPYAKNAKMHDRAQIEQLKRSITEFGMNDPIGIWKDNVIIEGHGRLIACKELGLDSIPVIRLDHLSDQQRKAYCLAHNQINMSTGFDLDLLSEELNSIFEFDMADFGFDLEKDAKEEECEEDYYEPEEDIPSIVKPGQKWRLGEHIILCGDSTNPQDMENLMGGGKG